jgi:EF hand
MKIHPTPQFGAALRPLARQNNTAAVQGGVPDAGVTFRGTEAPPVSANTIMQHWGTSNPEGDLNFDGIVDGQDLAMALNGPSDPQNTVLQNWGSGSNGNSVQGDYNGDGNVDAMDLAMALNGGNSPRSLSNPEGAAVEAKPEAVVAQIVDAAFAARDTDSDGTLEKQDFADNRRMFRHLDLDKSGSIGRDELTKALTSELERVRERFPEVKPQAFARRWMDALTTGQNAPNMAQFERVQQLFSKPASPRATNQILSVRA